MNIVVVGPVPSENSTRFMISISDKNGSLLRGVKRCEDTGRLVPYLKPEKLLIIIFSDFGVALQFKEGIEEASARAGNADDIVHGQDAPVERRGSHNGAGTGASAEGNESSTAGLPHPPRPMTVG